MAYQNIVAFIRRNAVEDVRREIQKLDVHYSLTPVKGRGEYENYLTPWELDSHVRIDIFVESEKGEKIVCTIMDFASSGMAGDGIIAVLPVESVYRIRTKSLRSQRSECDAPGKAQPWQKSLAEIICRPRHCRDKEDVESDLNEDP